MHSGQLRLALYRILNTDADILSLIDVLTLVFNFTPQVIKNVIFLLSYSAEGEPGMH